MSDFERTEDSTAANNNASIRYLVTGKPIRLYEPKFLPDFAEFLQTQNSVKK